MNAWEPLPRALAPPKDVEPENLEPFAIVRPQPGGAVPLVFASPHSGRIYPRALRARLGAPEIRRSEDAFVDALIGAAPLFGVRTITARLARVFIDVNRDPGELDPDMFDEALPIGAQTRTRRVAAGLGAIARIVREGEEVYDRKLSFAEAEARIEAVHRPYHAALAGLMAEAAAAAGSAVLVDWHSMPAREGPAAPRASGPPPDVVLGDRFGCACAPAVTDLLEGALRDFGYRVRRNVPYAGGYTTERYGRPARGMHAVQIELARSLYMDEDRIEATAGLGALKADLERLFSTLAQADWRALLL